MRKNIIIVIIISGVVGVIIVRVAEARDGQQLQTDAGEDVRFHLVRYVVK